MKLFNRRSLFVLCLLVGINSASAEIQIQGTRVIYPAKEREVTISVDNVGNGPRLIQAWVDSGDAQSTAETAKAPFLVSPPMSRIEPNKGQALRIMFTGADVPQDRESVFYLNVLEIPPRPTEDMKQFLQFAVRSRLKLFYRPASLTGFPLEAFESLKWRVVNDGQGMAVECINSTEYHVTATNIRFHEANSSKEQVSGMCAPKATTRIPLPADVGAAAGSIFYNVINDYGGVVEQKIALTP